MASDDIVPNRQESIPISFTCYATNILLISCIFPETISVLITAFGDAFD